MIRAVIFDFNGVLVDDEHLHFALFRDLLAERGVALDERAYYEEYVGFDDRGAFSEALRRAGQPVEEAELAAIIERKARMYLERAAAGLTYFPGASECVRSLAAQWPVAINSGALRAEIELAIDRMGVAGLISAIVSAEDTDRSKPDPEGYLLALDALRARWGEDLEAGHCVVIEDTAAGVEAAKSAGMWVVGILNTASETTLRHAGADVVRTSLVGVDPAWIRSLFAPEVSP